MLYDYGPLNAARGFAILWGYRAQETVAGIWTSAEKLREARKLSQTELAELSGIDQTYISLLERGQRQPALPTLYGLARGLDTRINELPDELEGR